MGAWNSNGHYHFSETLAQTIRKNVNPAPPEYRLRVTITPTGGASQTVYSNYAAATVPGILNTDPPATGLAVRGAVVTGMSHSIRDDRGFTLTELLVVISLLSMVLVVAYSALQLTFRATEIQKRDSFISTSVTQPIQIMDVIISQNLSIDAGSGDYLLSVLTDQNADNARSGTSSRRPTTVASWRPSMPWERTTRTPPCAGPRCGCGLSPTRPRATRTCSRPRPLFSYYKTDENGVLRAVHAGRSHRVRRAHRSALRHQGLLRPAHVSSSGIDSESGAGPMRCDIRSIVRDDRGIALVVVIGAIALVSVFAVGGFAMASQAMHSTGRLQTEELAFQVANSGMERELATFTESNFSSGQTTYQSVGLHPRWLLRCAGWASTRQCRIDTA